MILLLFLIQQCEICEGAALQNEFFEAFPLYPLAFLLVFRIVIEIKAIQRFFNFVYINMPIRNFNRAILFAHHHHIDLTGSRPRLIEIDKIYMPK